MVSEVILSKFLLDSHLAILSWELCYSEYEDYMPVWDSGVLSVLSSVLTCWLSGENCVLCVLWSVFSSFLPHVFTYCTFASWDYARTLAVSNASANVGRKVFPDFWMIRMAQNMLVLHKELVIRHCFQTESGFFFHEEHEFQGEETRFVGGRNLEMLTLDNTQNSKRDQSFSYLA